MTARPKPQGSQAPERTLYATASTTWVGTCQAGPVWTPDPWGRSKPDQN